MIFKINGLDATKEAVKTKAKSRVAGGPAFADFLAEAQSTDEAAAPALTTPALGPVVAGFPGLEEEDDLPKDSQGQARALLQTLKDLAEDAFAGNPTNTVARLEKLAQQVGTGPLTPQQQQVVDELKTRAAVEAAKLRS